MKNDVQYNEMNDEKSDRKFAMPNRMNRNWNEQFIPEISCESEGGVRRINSIRYLEINQFLSGVSSGGLGCQFIHTLLMVIMEIDNDQR